VTAGEQWTRDRLAELRARHYRLGAWAEFLRLSLERAREARRARPELERQLERWMLGWLAASAATQSLAPLRLLPVVPCRRELALWTTTGLLLRWHLGMVEGPEGQPRARFSPADAATLGRLWITPRLRRSGDRPAVLLSLLAAGGASDVLDGQLARRYGETRLGRDLDRAADVIFFAAAGAAARRGGLVGVRASRAMTFRAVAPAAYTTGHYFLRGGPPSYRPTSAVRVANAVVFAAVALAATGRDGGDALVAAASAAALAGQAVGVLRARPRAVSARRGAPPPRRAAAHR
jgi:phosphatidylglycerophosphate synthase